MPQTSNFNLTYPDSTGHPRTWEHWQQLAEDTDAALGEVRTGIVADPITTGGAGTPTSGTTEVRDAVLGDYVFTAVAGRRYEVMLTGGMSTTVANDVYEINVRDGGGSTPTTGSTLVAQTWVIMPVTGGPGQHYWPPCINTFAPAAGTRTLSVFTRRVTGTGVGTPVRTRELYVKDIGPA